MHCYVTQRNRQQRRSSLRSASKARPKWVKPVAPTGFVLGTPLPKFFVVHR